ncbi:MAG: cell surface protein SprA, partial [Bacteroidetes bacterium SW_10_40_5]
MPREWELASTPEKQPGLIPNASALNDLSGNYQRAKFSWYRIDDLFFRNNNLTPDHIKADQSMQSNHYMREVLETEVFPNKQLPSGVPATMRTFDIAYFPNERGPYNYNYQEIKENGELANPEQKWGGIMRSIDQIDFQSANVEYIEFWMLDPFIYNENQQGGTMYINLGNVSEDILKDGVKSFENGMPKDGNLGQDVTETAWGYAPITTPINFAFANDPDSRKYQDVGLDGLTDDRERSFFDSTFLQRLDNQYGTGSEAYQQAQADPSADNYHFYRGSDYDQQERNIIQRYKDYNNHHGNSPTPEQWDEEYPTTGGLEPDVEDINNDFTLNQLEEYFQYEINITPSQLKVGQNYITDKRTANVKLENGNRESVTWYQFKIPVRSYDKKVGQVQGFKSVRFMRLFMNGFQDSVICRLADFNLVRGDWRRYLEDLSDPGEVIVGDPLDTTSFDIATVNIEENGDRDPINYVLPPGIEREVRYDRSELLQQNEQSLALRVNNLEDGDARAAFKNTSYDIRRYKNLEMYVHAEGSMDNRQMETGDLWLFLRLGTDFNQNYYEYAVPLKPTDEGATSAEAIWPSFNNIDLSLEQLGNAKIQRDRSNQALNEIFITPAKGSNGIIRVRGNPDLSDVQTFMLGVRNPKQDDNTYQDNGEPISSEVWVNELRVSNFDESGGWAANAKVETKLADFGNLTLSGSRKTIGFGGIEESLQ